MADFMQLQQELGYQFQDVSLLKLALTHPSHHHKHNQRLEFLGDAVLELCVSEKIFEKHPEMQEGAMTQLRQKLVREEKLAKAAESIHLGDAILMDKGCALSGGRKNPSVLCDAFEAVLAAVYLDGGLEAARAVVTRLIGDCSEKGENDGKSALQEYLQAKGKIAPVYQTIAEEGPPHDRRFTVAVVIDGKEISQGTGTSKKRAEQAAATAALELIQRSGV
ncbi:MAG: ribonuclease III [Clostridia bacterium]|nr:ribonuclease III [Clostridiales bacterium]MBQ2977744.1 ribonuclease III [Clostridia bacterium]MBQ6804044.1 ribonuclease III [Clostridia bacterium]MDD6683778.1 ribonuclease III [Clostridiales bacterium]